jgi:ferritin-like metal-binding protein YciE
MSLKTLEDLFVHELKDILHAEKQILRALPKMAKATESETLQAAFEVHREQTEGQVARLEEIFEMLEKPARAKRCVGMEGLIEEGTELMEEGDLETPAMDAGLIACAQKVEHYEICAYGTLVAYANQLGMSKAARLLQQTLDEEKETDEKLTDLASAINFEAVNADQE